MPRRSAATATGVRPSARGAATDAPSDPPGDRLAGRIREALARVQVVADLVREVPPVAAVEEGLRGGDRGRQRSRRPQFWLHSAAAPSEWSE
jgi:hypothetical protein